MELNQKTKVMCFGDEHVTLDIVMNGRILEQVSCYKFVGIMVDEKLSFEQHVEFACGKTKAALNKISILLNGRRGLPVGNAIELYKGMSRPHLEYASAVWMYKNQKFMKEIQSVQQTCLKKLCGVFKNSSGAALEVITGVHPIDLRLKKLCRREWARIRALDDNHPLQKMLKDAKHTKGNMTPLSFLKHTCRKIEQNLASNSASIRKHQPLIPELIVKSCSFEPIRIFEGKIGNSKSRSQTQIQSALSEMEVFLEDKLGVNLLIFTDGSAMEKSIGKGGCGAVVVPPEGEVQACSKFVSNFTENVECEVEGLVLALAEAVKYYNEKGKQNDCCYIFTDCESAIDILVYQNDVVRWSAALQRAWSLKKQLDELDILVKIGWVPGHCGIKFNELADAAAKKGCSMIDELEKRDELSYSSISKWIDSLVMCEWQDQWSRNETGLFTKEILPSVQNNVKIPLRRDVGVAFVRCLLNNASVADNMFRMKLSDDPNCSCGKSRETVEHVLLYCEKIGSQRLLLKTKIYAIWQESKKFGNLPFDLRLLLNPSSIKLNLVEAGEVSKAFEDFLNKIEITL